MIYDFSELFIDLSNLEVKYSELMKSYNIPYSPHITCFPQKLKQQVPGLKGTLMQIWKSSYMVGSV